MSFSPRASLRPEILCNGHNRSGDDAVLDLRQLTDAELIAFTRALHEARFPEVESDPLVWVAPFVVDWYESAIAEDRRRMAERGDQAGLDRLEAWLKWTGRPEWPLVVRRLREDPALRALALGEGASFLRRLLRPFVLDDDDVARLTLAVAGVS